MTSLAAEIEAFLADFDTRVPADVRATMRAADADLRASGIIARALAAGAAAPDFVLPDALGRDVRLANRLAQGPVILTFYRGGWCPYCKLELRAWLIVGVDRLDYSKGIEERFMGYDRFLLDNPEAGERVFLLQIATISREQVGAYQDLRTRLDAAAGRINGEHATFDWVPLRYVNAFHRRDELAGIYRAAQVGLVTPLRDGMNLVAKEYVAAQDPEDPGVLILSRFAGTAAQMREALVVNPFSREEIAEALRRALAMPLHERRQRWTSLQEGVARDDVFAWSDAFLAALAGPDAPAAVAA